MGLHAATTAHLVGAAQAPQPTLTGRQACDIDSTISELLYMIWRSLVPQPVKLGECEASLKIVNVVADVQN